MAIREGEVKGDDHVRFGDKSSGFMKKGSEAKGWMGVVKGNEGVDLFFTLGLVSPPFLERSLTFLSCCTLPSG